MNKCRITVLKRQLSGASKKYSSDPQLGACDIYVDGQEFILEKPDMPEVLFMGMGRYSKRCYFNHDWWQYGLGKP